MTAHKGPSVRLLTWTSRLSLTVYAVTAALLATSLKRIGQDLGVGPEQLGTIAMLRATMLAISALITGMLADRYGKRAFMAGSFVTMVAGLAVVGFSGTFGVLLVGLGIMSFGMGPVESITSPLIAELHPDDLASQMSILHAFYPAGLVVTPLVVGRLLDLGAPWQAGFLIVAVPTLAIGGAFGLARYPKADRSSPEPVMGLGGLIRLPGFWLLAVLMLFGAGCEGGFAYWLPHYVQTTYGASALVGGAALTLFSTVMMVARFGTGAVLRVVRLPVVLFTSSAAGIGCVVALRLAPPLGVGLALTGLAGACTALFWPATLTLAAERITPRSTTLFAALSAIGIVGFGFTPQLMGLVAGRFGPQATLVPVGGAFVAYMAALVAVMTVPSRGGGRS